MEKKLLSCSVKSESTPDLLYNQFLNNFVIAYK